LWTEQEEEEEEEEENNETEIVEGKNAFRWPTFDD